MDQTPILPTDDKDRKSMKNDRPKVSPPDPPIQHHPRISVCTPAKKLHDIGKRPPPQLPSGATAGPSTEPHSSKATNLGLNTPSTPRIDISRASSSSHHEDSRDSSPENVFEQVMILCVFVFVNMRVCVFAKLSNFLLHF